MWSNEKLNKEQLRAVKHKEGPLLIIAGAGTGKTTVVTERVKFLIERGHAKPSEILALTFTEKAATEMETRIDESLPYGYTQMWVMTFHSFCDRVLRREALHIGLDPRYKLMTEAESIQLVRNNLFEFDLNYFRPLGNPNKFVSGLLQHFSRLQDEDVSPSEYITWAEGKRLKVKGKSVSEEEQVERMKWLELAEAYRKYDEIKIREGFFDFGDLIIKTLKLFRQRKNILREYQKQFKYILVDEFQDVNFAQNQLAIMLAGKGKSANITACGDDDQSIYRFRGAAVSNIIQFRKTYPKAKIVVLTKNYRSTQEILDRAYDLIQYNNPDRLEVVENINKRLQSTSKSKNDVKISFFHSNRVENEAEKVAQEVQKLITSSNKSSVINYQYKDIAILVRANNHAEPFMRAFQRVGIPYQFLGPGRLFKQAEIIDLISYLRVLYNFEDSVSLYRLLSIDYFNIDAKDLVRISNYSRKYNLPMYEALSKVDEIYISDKTKEVVQRITKIIDRQFKLLNKETAGQLLYNFLDDTGLLQTLLNPDTVDAEKRAKNISKFFDKLKTYEADHEEAGVRAVVDWIELSSEIGESPLAVDIDWTASNAVNLLTVHSAKGLEFPVVFLVNLVANRFPSIERREQIPISDELIKEVLPKGDFHTEEERRLFYVGMTRAKEKLYFTASDYYGEGKRLGKLSAFIFEALGDEVTAKYQPSDISRQLSFLDYQQGTKPIAKVQQQKAEFHIDYLSFSQIDAFRMCELHYKLRYILGIPTPPNPALSFGSSIHATMRDFYLKVKDGEKSTEKLILSILKDDWVKEGYPSLNHERKMFERGRNYLADYLKKQFDKNILPEVVEKPFVIPLNFRFKKDEERPLRIGGKIDRVDTTADGSIEIIDYKTGESTPDQKAVDKDLQLTFYALAATMIHEPPFNKNPDEVKLSLYYFDKQEKISTIRTREDLEVAVDEIFEWRRKIENSDFHCTNSYMCQKCEYKLWCDQD